jgi:hypothetical protein
VNRSASCRAIRGSWQRGRHIPNAVPQCTNISACAESTVTNRLRESPLKATSKPPWGRLSTFTSGNSSPHSGYLPSRKKRREKSPLSPISYFCPSPCKILHPTHQNSQHPADHLHAHHRNSRPGTAGKWYVALWLILPKGTIAKPHTIVTQHTAAAGKPLRPNTT